MKRYHSDYGVEFHSPTNRRQLRRDEAARVVAAPIVPRTSGHGKAIAGHRGGDLVRAVAAGVAIALAYAAAWVVAFNWY